ncbi:hypothetical protein HY624_02210 [Candidatus Uhrbacteria bacterium]|nr:hypothetical protein [Candidatus Uhrbacteria bacterium]
MIFASSSNFSKLLIVRTAHVFYVALVLFVALLFVAPHSFISPDIGGTILTITTFLFGFIAGFYILLTATDYNTLKGLLANETASWIVLHQYVTLYMPRTVSAFTALLDTYLRRAFDFEIIDYARGTQAEFEPMRAWVNALQPKKGIEYIHENIQETMQGIIIGRQQLTVLGTKTLSLFQWMVLCTLAALVIFSLYGVRSGELFFDIVTVLISSSVVLILLVIRDLDLYLWNEKTFGYDIFENLFKAIGQQAYYPEESIQKGRIHPTEETYRVGVVTNRHTLERRIDVVTQKKI